MNEKADWICAKIQKIKEFQAVVERKFSKLVLNTTEVHYKELTTFNEANMALQQSEGIDTANKRVATLPQRQLWDFMGAANKGNFFFHFSIWFIQKQIFSNREGDFKKRRN